MTTKALMHPPGSEDACRCCVFQTLAAGFKRKYVRSTCIALADRTMPYNASRKIGAPRASLFPHRWSLQLFKRLQPEKFYKRLIVA